MDQNIKRLYLSAAHLLTDSFVLPRKEDYPQARVMDSARRGLLQACFRFDPSKGVKFIRYAEFWIRNSVRRCLVEEVPESKPGGVKSIPPDILKQIEKYRALVPEEVRRARHEQRRHDVAKSVQWEKTVEQARLYRKLMKNR